MRLLLLALFACLPASAALSQHANPESDAPEMRVTSGLAVKEAASYAEALARWRNADDVNAWIGAHFEYDMSRAMQLSETQRSRSGRLPIHAPERFFAAPAGVCVDLSRFAVETLREIDAKANPRYVMIEFDPVSIAGNTLRRHWVAAFQRDGAIYVFADSKRPGHIAGPYTSMAEYVAEYARYRGRAIVSFTETPSYERKQRSMAVRKEREGR